MAITNINEYVPVIVNQEFDWFPKDVVTADELNKIFDNFKTQGNYTAEALTTVIEKINFNYSELRRDVDALTAGTVPDGAITTEKLADGAITTEKFADESVTKEKISSEFKDPLNKNLIALQENINKLTAHHNAEVATLYAYIKHLHGLQDIGASFQCVIPQRNPIPSSTSFTLNAGTYYVVVITPGTRASSIRDSFLDSTKYSIHSAVTMGGKSGVCCVGRVNVSADDIFTLTTTQNISYNHTPEVILKNDRFNKMLCRVESTTIHEIDTAFFNICQNEGVAGQLSSFQTNPLDVHIMPKGAVFGEKYSGYFSQLPVRSDEETLPEIIKYLNSSYAGQGGACVLPYDVEIPGLLKKTNILAPTQGYDIAPRSYHFSARYTPFTAYNIAPVPQGYYTLSMPVGAEVFINDVHRSNITSYYYYYNATDDNFVCIKGLQTGYSYGGYQPGDEDHWYVNGSYIVDRGEWSSQLQKRDGTQFFDNTVFGCGGAGYTVCAPTYTGFWHQGSEANITTNPGPGLVYFVRID